MKLAVETGAVFRHYSIDDGARLIKETGFDAADMSFCDDSTEVFCMEDYREKAYEVKAAFEKYGLACSQAHAPYFFKYDSPQDDSDFQYLAIKRSIEAAGIMGVDHIVLHGVRVPYPSASRNNLDFNYGFLKGFEPLCEKYNVKISLENLSGAFTYPDLLNAMIGRLDSPWYTGLVDIGHAFCRGGLQPGDFIRQLDPGILTGLHVQDTHGIDDEHMLPYMGNIDFDDLMHALYETGYKGDFTFEACAYLTYYGAKGLLEPALRFEAAIGRKLIGDFEKISEE
ncbi:MAG: sugar phosphate isomerase/epimerase [Lachnospiraceae bacterium]|nr:sugar phosphate isomerase/epimerase [Lachnospiraceae bacterium]